MKRSRDDESHARGQTYGQTRNQTRDQGRERTRDVEVSADQTGHRHARLSLVMLEELRSLLRDDVADPSVRDLHIQAVRLSVDYRNARIHFTVVSDLKGDEANIVKSARAARLKDVERGFERATPFLRSQLGASLDIKRVPELRFVFDGWITASEVPQVGEFAYFDVESHDCDQDSPEVSGMNWDLN